MGFLPEVRRLLDATNAHRQTLLFSATLDGDVDVLVRNYQRDPARYEIVPDEAGPVGHHLWVVGEAERTERAAELVMASTSAMVFTRTRHGADRLVKRLRQAGVNATQIHGGRSQAQRDLALDDFRRGRVRALVATDVAARGIHVDGVACVIQYDLPPDAKDYVHRAGRTGRAGADGMVVTFAVPAQRTAAEKLLASIDADVTVTTPGGGPTRSTPSRPDHGNPVRRRQSRRPMHSGGKRRPAAARPTHRAGGPQS
jgi:superfamily II DNA/RNA helicase